MTTIAAAQTRPGTGVVIPLCTPLTPGGEIDSPSLRRHLDHLINNGVDGVFALGTSGEFGFLTDRQRVAVVRTTVDHVAGRVPVLVGVSDTASERAAAQVRLLMGFGADGAVATAPFFAATGPAEIAAHFRRIKQELGELPLFGYENPPRVNGVSIPVTTVLDLAEDGTLAGYKDSSGDLDYLAALLTGRRERGLDAFRVLSGSETLAAESLRAGADGLVPGLGNVDPAGYVRIYSTAGVNDAVCDAEQQRLRELFAIVAIPTHTQMGDSSRALGAFKAAMKLLDLIDEDRCAPPSVLYDDTDRARVAALLRAHGPSPRGALSGTDRMVAS
ncbi:dihydrodipicolinate synthase family protein [Brachybacterium sp. Marseille-Q7125]|uniref:dihydrodipicolinate synthase family protein n=1 Tax=Brachybacterium sp. Marseille-Q7125 TaxID=2932815 RepID=UPI001FF53609|nr:dihydrodipicolinate synthase family protein [Brachybacterium sp. Marseille-Q7125]